MNARERRAAKRVGVQKGFGPRHAFNAQEGEEAVPSPLPEPSGGKDLNYLGRYLAAMLRDTEEGMRPSVETIEEVLRHPVSAKALEQYAKSANVGIMMMPGMGGVPHGTPRSGKVPQPGLKVHDPAPRYEGPPEHPVESGNWFKENEAKADLPSGLSKWAELTPEQQASFQEHYGYSDPKQAGSAWDNSLSQWKQNNPHPDEQFPSLNKPPYDALKEVPPEYKGLKGLEHLDEGFAPGEPGSDAHYEKWLEGKKFKDQSAADDAYWQEIGASDKAAKQEFLDKHTHDFEVQDDMTLKKLPPEEPPLSPEEQLMNESGFEPKKVTTHDGYEFTKQPDGTWGNGDMSWDSYPEMIKDFEKDGIRYDLHDKPFGGAGDTPQGSEPPDPDFWKKWSEHMNEPPEEPPFPTPPPRFKKGTTGVRHNPKTKTGRPKKIGVEKGHGPRHAANAKEGQDLTEINTDTVPAMLTPREAVLNRNAAELAGRDEIEALNQQGNALAKQGVDLAAEGMADVKERIMKSKQKQSSSGSPYVQGFEAQKAKGYEGGVAKLPKPPESVGSLGTPMGYTNTNKWGNPYGWNPGTPPQLGGGPDPRGNGPFPEPPGGVLGHPGGQTDPGYVAKLPPGGMTNWINSTPHVPGGQGPVGTQNVNQYGVPYGWNPGTPGLGGGAGLGTGPTPWQGGAPTGWTAPNQPLKSGGLYPPGQGIFHGATGASDILGEGDSIYGDQPPVNLSAPGGLAEMVAALKKEAAKQGLSASQIQGILGAFQGMGGGGSGYANQSLSAGEDFGNPNYIGLGTPSYQGGISEVGYPPGIAPNAAFSYDEGGWTGLLDPRWSHAGYQGGTSGVPGLYKGENDFRGGGGRPSTIATGAYPPIGGVDLPNEGPSQTPNLDRWEQNQFGPDFRMGWMGGGRLGYQPPPWAAGFTQGPTMIPTTLGNSGYPRAVLASSDWNKSGAPSHTPRKNKS